MIALLFEATVFSAALVLAVRVATKPPLRRDAAEFPAFALGIAVAGSAILAALLWEAARWPAFRHSVVAAALLGISFAWWRARPAYGRRRGWPPGSLGIARSLDAVGDRRFYRNQAEAHGPIFKTSQFGRPVVCVVGLPRGRQLLADHPEALVAATLPYNRRLPRGTLRYMADRDHRDEAPLFRTTFASIALGAGEDGIRDACRSMLMSVARESASTPTGVRAREYFSQWLLVALSRVFFGLDATDARIADIDRVMSELRLHRAGGPFWHRRLESALVRVTAIMRGIGRDDATSSPPVAAGSALRAFLDTMPDALDDPTRARNLFLAFRISHGDLTGLADWLFFMLGEHAEWQGRVRAAGRTHGEPDGAQPGDVGTRVVLETLRMEQSEYLYRRIAQPMQIGPYAIPVGWLLRICVQESHRDASVFDDPDRFDPDRFISRRYSRSEYSPFGADTRGCMGARIAHFLGRILVEELCLGYEWRVVRTGPPERGSRQRDHWRPSAASRVVLRATR